MLAWGAKAGSLASGEPNNVFFVFEVTNLDRAQTFISDPASAEAGRTSGVLDGEYHFLETGAVS